MMTDTLQWWRFAEKCDELGVKSFQISTAAVRNDQLLESLCVILTEVWWAERTQLLTYKRRFKDLYIHFWLTVTANEARACDSTVCDIKKTEPGVSASL